MAKVEYSATGSQANDVTSEQTALAAHGESVVHMRGRPIGIQHKNEAEHTE